MLCRLTPADLVEVPGRGRVDKAGLVGRVELGGEVELEDLAFARRRGLVMQLGVGPEAVDLELVFEV